MPHLGLSGSLVVAAVLALALMPVNTPAQDAQPVVNPVAAALADFQKRIEAYRALHDEAAKGSAQMHETDDPAEIRKTQADLAARLRKARPNAHQGDIFTPEIRAVFRRLMYPEMKEAAVRETKADVGEDIPRGVRLKVNASYPEGQPLPTVPANLLVNLPRLPKDLEYRIVDRHLILRDVDANLIVDFIPNAIR